MYPNVNDGLVITEELNLETAPAWTPEVRGDDDWDEF